MRRTRIFVIAAVLLVIVGTLFFAYQSWQKRKQEATYQAIVTTYASYLHAGMTRADTQRNLKNRSISFESRRMGAISD